MEEFDAYKKDLVTPGAPFSHSSMKPYKVFRGGLRRKRECCFSFPGSPFTHSPLARVQFLWTHPRRPEEWRQSFSPLPTARKAESHTCSSFHSNWESRSAIGILTLEGFWCDLYILQVQHAHRVGLNLLPRCGLFETREGGTPSTDREGEVQGLWGTHFR